MKRYRFRFFRFGRRPRKTSIRSTSVLFKRFSSFEGLELRAVLSGDSLLSDSALVGSAQNDVHESPVERLCISSLMASNVGQGGEASPLAATADEPSAEPLVTGIAGNVTVVLEDLSGNPLTQLQAGQDFRLKVFVDDVRTNPNLTGFAAAYVRLNYNTSLISLTNPSSLVVSQYFRDYGILEGTSSEATTPAGTITAGGTSLNFDPEEIPNGDPQLLYTVTLRAVASGSAQFTTSFYEVTDRDWLMYGNDGTTVDAGNITFNNATLNVTAQPTLSIGDVSNVEGDTGTQQYVFTVTLSESSTQAVTVAYSTQAGTANGDAGSLQDFVPTSGTLNFEPGAVTKTITVLVRGDTLSEGDEKFTVTLANPTGATLADGVADGTIVDNDNPLITIGSKTQAEGDTAGTMVFTVTLSKPSTGNVTVVYNTANGTATAGSDYTATSGTLTFTPGGSLTREITVAILGDDTLEDNETFELNLSSPVGAQFGEGNGEAIGTLTNDDGPVLSILPGSVSKTEGDTNSTVVLTVSLSEASTETVIVVYNTANGTATAGSDYSAQSGTLTFLPGQPLTQEITLQLLGDNIDEADETFSVVLSSPSNASIASATSIVTILDDEGPTITVTGPASVNENSGSYVLTVTLSSPSQQPVSAAWATANGTATAGSDYTSASGTVSFDPGQTVKHITISLLGDTTREPNETFTVNFTNPVGGELADDEFVATIANDDELPQVEIIAPAGQNEGHSGSTPLVFTVRLSSANSDGVTVVYNTANITGTAGSDYTAQSGTLTFSPTQTEAFITILATGDLTFETDETFRVDISSPTGATLKTGGNSATGRILNDDPRPTISIGDAQGSEGDSGTKQFEFTVTMTNSSTETVTVQYTTQNGSATGGNDFQTTSGTLTFAPGQTTAVITVNVIGDKFNESDETFTVLLSNPVNGTINDAAGIGTILDEAGDDVNITPSQISGRVTSGTSNKNLAGIEVRLTGSATMTTTTNGAGLYSFANLQPGKYTVKFVLPDQYKDGVATLSNEDGELAALVEDGFEITIDNPGGLAADDYNFKTPGLKPQFYSARMLMASTISSESEGVGQVSVSVSNVTTPITGSTASNTTISGTGTIGATISVVASAGGQSTAAKTTTVGADGTWTITGINVSSLPDGEIRYDVTATGDGSTDTAFITTVKDTVAPTVDITNVTNPVNSDNEDDTTISGTASPNATITVTVSDGTTTTSPRTTTANASGQWSISGIDVSSLDDGTITYTAQAKDSAGNTATDTITSTKNSDAPALAVVTFPAVVGPNNQNNVTISGTAEPNSTITLNITDSASGSITQRTAEVDGSGNWSVTDINLTSLAAGKLTVTVVVTDDDNNTNTVTKEITKDMATQVAITSATDPVNEGNVESASISGTAEANATLVIVISDGENEVTVNATADGQGNWTKTGIDLSELTDGEITYKVTATDAVGNTAIAERDAVKDVEDLDLEIDEITAVIKQSNDDEFTITGSVMPGSTVVVIARNGATALDPVNATVAENGDWTVTLDLSELADGTITFDVVATQGEEEQEDSATATKDTVAEGAFGEVTDPVNGTNVETANANGTVELDATVTIFVKDSEGNTTDTVTVPAVAGVWASDPLDLSELENGEITYVITITDEHGNVNVYELDAFKDTEAPELTVNAIEGPLGIAAAASLNLGGTGNDPDATIKIVVSDGTNETQEYTATVDASGNWTVTGINVLSLNDGTLTFTVTSEDEAGNVTTNSARTVVKETVSVDEIEGVITENNEDEITVSGTVDPDATVSVIARNGAQALAPATATVDENGNWTVTINVSSLADGTITFDVVAMVGDDSAETSTTAEKDTVAEGEILGTTDPINLASAGAVDINGTVEPGSDATLLITSEGGGTPISIELVVQEDGTWSVADEDLTTLPEGMLTFKLTVTDEHGNVDEYEVEVLKDTVAPELDINALDPIGLGDVANTSISGTGTPNAAIKVIVSDGTNQTTEYTGTADGTGAWTITGISVSSLNDGLLTFTVTSRDASGNETTDTATAEKQTVQIVLWPTTVHQGNEAAAVISGTSQPGSTIVVTITDGTNVVTAAEVDVEANGNWATTVDLSGLDDGELTITVTATDGDSSATDTAEATKDTVAEGTIAAATTAVTPANVTAAGANGTSEAGATVKVRVIGGEEGSEVIVGPIDATVNAEAWSVANLDLTTLPNGPIRYEVTVTDSHGNQTVYLLDGSKDLSPPAVTMNAITGPINSAGAPAVQVTGTSEAGATVVVEAKVGASTVTSEPVVVDESGNWTATVNVSTLGDGTVEFKATATDTVGNETETAVVEVAKDTVAHVTINNSVFVNHVKSSNETAVSLLGSREANSSVHITVSDGTNVLEKTVAAGTGGWSTQMDLSSLNDGTLTLTVVATDPAGNTATESMLVLKDTVTTVAVTTVTDPVTPDNAATTSISGTGEQDATIEVTVTDGVSTTIVYSIAVAANGTWAINGIDVSALENGQITYNVTSTDVSGNTDTTTAVVDKEPAAELLVATSGDSEDGGLFSEEDDWLHDFE